jgi:hypothetical protein
MTNRLRWDVLVSAQIPVVTSDLPPGASEVKWSPISSTLRLSLLWLNWFFVGTQSSLSGDSASYPRRQPRNGPVVRPRIWTAVILSWAYRRLRVLGMERLLRLICIAM